MNKIKKGVNKRCWTPLLTFCPIWQMYMNLHITKSFIHIFLTYLIEDSSETLNISVCSKRYQMRSKESHIHLLFPLLQTLLLRFFTSNLRSFEHTLLVLKMKLFDVVKAMNKQGKYYRHIILYIKLSKFPNDWRKTSHYKIHVSIVISRFKTILKKCKIMLVSLTFLLENYIFIVALPRKSGHVLNMDLSEGLWCSTIQKQWHYILSRL